MIRKLNHEQLSDLILASDQQFLQEELAPLPAQARDAAERTEEFWAAQRVAVWSKIDMRETSKLRLPVLTGAIAVAVTALIVSGLLISPHKPQPALTIVQPQAISDQELLVQVERILQTDTPASLQPAGLITPAAQYQPAVQEKDSHEN